MRKFDRFAALNVRALLIVVGVAIVLVGGALAAHQVRRHVLAGKALAEGNTAFDRGDWDTARKRLAYWVARHPDDLTANLRLATAALSLRPLPPECIAQAMQAYRRVLRSDPAHLIAFERLAQIYQSTGDFGELDHVASVRLAALPDDPAATLELGRAQLQRKKLADARATLTRLADRARTDSAARPAAVEACLLLATLPPAPGEPDTDAELRWHARAVELNPDSALARVQHAALLAARAATATGDAAASWKQSADVELETAERLVGPDPRVRLLLADQWLARGDAPRAAGHLHAARTTDPVIVQKYVLDPASWTLALFDVAARLALTTAATEDAVALVDATLLELEGRAQRTQALPLAIELLLAASELDRARATLADFVNSLQTRGLNADGPQVALLHALVAWAEDRPFEVLRRLETLEVATLNPRARALLARAYEAVGQPARAARTLEGRPEAAADPQAAAQLARLYLAQGEWAQARTVLAPRAALAPDDADLQFLLASAEVGAALDGDPAVDLAQTAERLRTLRALRPDWLEVRLMIATLREHQDGPAAAEQELTTAAAECPQPLPALLALAVLQQGQGRTAEALAGLRAACERFPGAAAAWLALAEMLAQTEDLPAARAALARGLEQVAETAGQRQIHLRLAQLEILSGARDAGCTRLRELAAADPQDVEVRTLLLEVLDLAGERAAATALLVELARIEGAETIAATEDEIQRIEGPSGLLWRLHLARYWLAAPDAAARASEIEKLLRRCTAADPHWTAPVLLLGEFYERHGRLDDAEAVYRTGFEARGAPAIALRWLDLLQRQDRFAEALELYQRSGAQLDDRTRSTWRLRAALQQRDLTGAVRELELRVAGPLATPDDLLLLAQLQYEQTGAVEQAFDTLTRALERGAPPVEVARVRVSILRAANRTAEAVTILDELVRAHPQPEAFLLRGAWWLRQAEPTRAEQDFQALAESAPDDSGYALLGDFYAGRQQHAAAIAAAEAGLRKFPASARLKRGLAGMLLARQQPGDDARASALLTELAGQSPDDPELLRLQIARQLQLGTPAGRAEARRLLASLPPAAPLPPATCGALASLALQLQEPLLARTLAERGLALAPDNPDLKLVLADAALAAGDLDVAQRHAAAVLEQPRATSNHLHTALALCVELALRRADSAALQRLLRQVQDALARTPGQADLQVLAARAQAALGERAAARAALEEFCRQAPGAAHVPALLQLAELCRDAADFAAAERWLDAAATVAPTDPRVRRARLLLLAGAGRAAEIPAALEPPDTPVDLLLTGALLLRDAPPLRDAALALARRAAAADPESALAQAQLALLLYQSGDATAALQTYEALLVRVPDHAEALNNVAWILAERGTQLPRALELARQAVALRPADANFRDTLGTVLRRSGQLTAARAEFLRGLELTNASDHVHASLLLHAAETAAELNDWTSVRDLAETARTAARVHARPEHSALEALHALALERLN